MSSLYSKHRPQTLQGLLGQDSAVEVVKAWMFNGQAGSGNHTMLLNGPSGVGKTTIARIVKSAMGCGDADFREVNCSDFRGIDDIREIRRVMNMAPISGHCRIWVLDECQKLTNDAQNSMLKMLEDTPKHVFFILATTDAQKLLKTIRTRATEIKLAPLKLDVLEKIIQRVVDKEHLKVSDEVIEEIASASDFSGRKALVLLEQVSKLEGEEKQLEAIASAGFNKEDAFRLAQLLFNFRREQVGWADIAKVLRDLAEQDAEGIRYCILGYARSVLVGKDEKSPNSKYTAKAFGIIEVFGKNFYDSKHAGLAAACWEVFNNL